MKNEIPWFHHRILYSNEKWIKYSYLQWHGYISYTQHTYTHFVYILRERSKLKKYVLYRHYSQMYKIPKQAKLRVLKLRRDKRLPLVGGGMVECLGIAVDVLFLDLGVCFVIIHWSVSVWLVHFFSICVILYNVKREREMAGESERERPRIIARERDRRAWARLDAAGDSPHDCLLWPSHRLPTDILGTYFTFFFSSHVVLGWGPQEADRLWDRV